MIKQELEGRYFEDIETKEKWTLDPKVVYKFPNKQEVLIQLTGNWRLVKWRKTSEIYDCLQCKVQMLILKHPSFVEVNLFPPEG